MCNDDTELMSKLTGQQYNLAVGSSPDLYFALPFSSVDAQLIRTSGKRKTKEKVQYTGEPKTLGQHLYKRRTDLQLTKKSVADSFIVSTMTLSSWERDAFFPDVRHMKNVIEFLGYYPFDEPKTWQERIKKYRQVHGLTLEQFGEFIGVSMPTVWTWENGKYVPSENIRRVVENLIYK
jgi:transcriptional regulator with XRE-family HTH domain